MTKTSAGILVYRRTDSDIEVLLGHPGGPFWKNKDQGAWSIPKGEFEDEEPIVAAKREFKEELGHTAPSGEYLDLGSITRKDGKTIYIWAVEGNLDVTNISSNTFEMEWPPHSGQKQSFPEIDKARWFKIEQTADKLHKGQDEFIKRLSEHLGIEIIEPPTQAQLF